MTGLARSLAYYWRNHLAVVLGAAVATAVLAGALVVGDSVRGSLRQLTLERLGRIDTVLVAERFVRQELAAEWAAELGGGAAVEPLVLLRGSAVAAASGARASQVTILGVGEGFADLYDEAASGAGEPASAAPRAGGPGAETSGEGRNTAFDFSRRQGQLFPSVILNQSLADELEVVVGDELLLTVPQPSDVPEETLAGRRDATEALASLRLAVAAVIPDRGAGGFSLTAHQGRSQNAFVELSRLQRALDQRRRVNALALAPVPGGEPAAPPHLEEALGRVVEAGDLGISLRRGAGVVVVESREFVLAPGLATVAQQLAGELGATAQPVLTYLANQLRVGEASLPYSTVSALEPAVDGPLALRLADGSPAPPLAAGELYLDRWSADDLGAAAGDLLQMTYYTLGPRDELSTAETSFRVAGVVEMAGAAADPTLTPDFPGMADANDIAAWEPPFPVDLDRIRPRDEEYWDRYRGAPKAFVQLAAGQELWRSRFGELTSVRLAPADGGDGALAELEQALARELPRRLEPAAAGLTLLPVRAQGLAAAEGATDFSQLFLAFSIFLIVSAALLVGLLFRLGVEQRAREVGLLRALGYRERQVRRRLLVEGGLLAALGALLGLGGAVGYAALMLAGLRSWWLPAVGAPVLFLHVEPLTLGIGFVASVLVVLVTIWLALRRLRKVPAPALLAGEVSVNGPAKGGRRARWLAVVLVALAAVLLVASLAFGAASSPALAFGTGACLLGAGLAAFAAWCRGGRRRANALGGAVLLGMGARNSARNAGRSILSVALVASACFVLVTVAANRGGGEVAVAERGSGAGGFPLLAEAEVSLVKNLDDPEERADLGFSGEAESAMAAARVYPFRLLPGEDASCLNLYRPTRPRVLGVPPELIERGGFTFQQLARPSDDPWQLLTDELEPGVIPAFADANSAQWILKKGLGDEISYESSRGETVRLRLVGLLAKSIFQSELLISEEAFVRHFPARTGYGYFLIDTPAEQVPAVQGALEASLAPFGFDVTSTAERLASYQAVEQTYLSTFQTLGGLGLLLGTLGLGVVLLRNVLERRGELAALRAFGFRRSLLTAMVLAENAFLLAVGLGIGTMAALVAVAPHLQENAAGVPWASLTATLAAIFLTGLAASLAAVAGTLRTPLLPALKAE